eukprot:5161799-Amphidinium_carterae.1
MRPQSARLRGKKGQCSTIKVGSRCRRGFGDQQGSRSVSSVKALLSVLLAGYSVPISANHNDEYVNLSTT